MLRYATAVLAATLPALAEPAAPDSCADSAPTPIAQIVQPEAPADAETPAPAAEVPAPVAEEPASAAEESTPAAEVPTPPAEEAVAVSPPPIAAHNTLADAYRGIVKIEVANRIPDYAVPWQAGLFGRGSGTGFMVGPGLFMTNAHVVANAERIYVSPYADARKIRATVKYVAHDADLALVQVEDAEAFKDVPRLEFSDTMPHLEDEVRAIG